MTPEVYTSSATTQKDAQTMPHGTKAEIRDAAKFPKMRKLGILPQVS